MRLLDIFILFLVIMALVLGGYFIWLNLPIGSETYKPYSANVSGYFPESYSANASSQVVQFYPNMRYPDKMISYNLASACSVDKFKDIQTAFSILSEKTILQFYQSSLTPEISVLCSDVAPKAEEKGHFIAGEGGPSEIINTTNFAVILSGKISLYRENKCDEPKVAIHEILHALGFDHYNNSRSILYPITSCEQQIDQGILDVINKLYSLDSLPDLIIESINAKREGRYLNFDINISNMGLIGSEGVELNLFSEGEKVVNFTLGDLDVGEKKILSVENVRLPGRANVIEFAVESNNPRELNIQNNRVEISTL